MRMRMKWKRMSSWWVSLEVGENQRVSKQGKEKGMY